MSRPLTNRAEPTTSTSTPCEPANSAVSRLIPPSTWSSPPYSLCLRISRTDGLRREDVGHERLPAGAGFDGHSQDDVEELCIGLERAQRGPGLDGQARGTSGATGRLERRCDRLLDLDMERDRVAAGVEVFVDEPARLVNHQVGIERERGPRSERLDRLRPEGQVRDEVGVHDVESPVGTRRHDRAARRSRGCPGPRRGCCRDPRASPRLLPYPDRHRFVAPFAVRAAALSASRRSASGHGRERRLAGPFPAS